MSFPYSHPRPGIAAYGILALLFLAFFGLPHPAKADCGTHAPGAIIYNADQKIFQYCGGTIWQRMNQNPGSGSGGCTNPAANEGDMIYNEDHRVMQGCAGNIWRPFGPVGGMNGWAQVSVGDSHGCGIKTDGTLWCWGSDSNGQIGNGATTGNQDSPVQESTGATDWLQVTAGGIHTCAIKTNGTLWCWGNDVSGQLGNGATTGDQDSPVQETTGATDWLQVEAGFHHTCAIKTDGTLWCWGSDMSGELGNGATAGNQNSPVQESTGATNWLQVNAGSFYTCAIKTDGTLWCWGTDGNYQLGNGATTGDQISPVQESTGATNWLQVTAGGIHTCAIKTDGTLWCWGWDNAGQLGNGTIPSHQNSPMQEDTAATNWAQVMVSGFSTCAVKTDGTLWCWGIDGVVSATASPVQESTGATDWLQVNNACATKTNGTLWCWKIGGSDPVNPAQESTGAIDWSTISTYANHTCALKTGGTLWCWGSDMSGQLGNGATAGNQNSPVQESSSTTNWLQVAAGNSHTCAIKTGGTLWCWGSDGNGQLGNGAASTQTSPMQEDTAAVNWAQVATGYNHTCAIKTGGTLWCWGADHAGQIGNGATTGNQISPVQEDTAATDWLQVAAGYFYTCAIKTGGTLWCWGSDINGQLGNGAASTQTSPMQEDTAAVNWAQVATGYNHTCAIKTGGTLWCWGSDMNGQLGNGATAGDQNSPVQEDTAATDWLQVATGSGHTCAVKTDGGLWCWGNNSTGQFGDGTKVNQDVPTFVGYGWESVTAGGSHTCGLTKSGQIWCWGSYTYGQLGIGTVSASLLTVNSICGNQNRSGSIVYNADHTRMQYCDGVGWVKMGR